MGVASICGYGLDKAGSQTVHSSAVTVLFLEGLILTYWSANKNLLEYYVALNFFWTKLKQIYHSNSTHKNLNYFFT